MKESSTPPIFIVLLIGAILPGLAYSQEHPTADEEMVRQLDERERSAVLAADTVSLKSLWSERFIVNNPQNRISSNRSEVLELVKRGLIRYSSFERTIEELRRFGDMIIIMGAEEVLPVGDAPRAGATVRRRFTNIWMNEGGTWRLVARHANTIPAV